jgi:hypothetical protein
MNYLVVVYNRLEFIDCLRPTSNATSSLSSKLSYQMLDVLGNPVAHIWKVAGDKSIHRRSLVYQFKATLLERNDSTIPHQ